MSREVVKIKTRRERGRCLFWHTGGDEEVFIQDVSLSAAFVAARILFDAGDNVFFHTDSKEVRMKVHDEQDMTDLRRNLGRLDLEVSELDLVDYLS